MYYPLLRAILFQFEPELAHGLALKSLRCLHQCHLLRAKKLVKSVKVMGLDFPNPVGLAAGLDKHGQYIDSLASLGFGFIEVGTITPRPQPGNPKPRLFRLLQAKAIINRMGFNSKGVEYAVNQIKRTNFTGILGINIGKNFDTPNTHAVEDYLVAMRAVYDYADYITVNISSPNTEDLRELQYGEFLNLLLANLKKEQQALAQTQQKYVPLVVKIAPDLTTNDIHTIANKLMAHQIDGVIATNTTIKREGVIGLPHANETGGLSGQPLFEKSLAVVRKLNKNLKGNIPIIAAGGINNIDNAQSMFNAGASLIQLYTGFIYHGPKLIYDIVSSLEAPTV